MELAKSTKLGSCGEADLLVQKLVRKQDKFFPDKTMPISHCYKIMSGEQYSRRQL